MAIAEKINVMVYRTVKEKSFFLAGNCALYPRAYVTMQDEFYSAALR